VFTEMMERMLNLRSNTNTFNQKISVPLLRDSLSRLRKTAMSLLHFYSRKSPFF
jgi:hypothetical protein